MTLLRASSSWRWLVEFNGFGLSRTKTRQLLSQILKVLIKKGAHYNKYETTTWLPEWREDTAKLGDVKYEVNNEGILDGRPYESHKGSVVLGVNSVRVKMYDYAAGSAVFLKGDFSFQELKSVTMGMRIPTLGVRVAVQLISPTLEQRVYYDGFNTLEKTARFRMFFTDKEIALTWVTAAKKLISMSSLVRKVAPQIFPAHFGLVIEEKHRLALGDLAAHAQSGDGIAINSVGVAYREGKIVPSDYTFAFECFEGALSSGHEDEGIPFNLALCSEFGHGTEKDLAKALKYYTQAANLGHKMAKQKAEEVRALLEKK